jgi:hypothetical protein
MAKISRMAMVGISQAMESKLAARLGALVTKGNTIMSTGFNNCDRSSFLKKHDICQHAEMAAATKFINSYVRRNSKKFTYSRGKNLKGSTNV